MKTKLMSWLAVTSVTAFSFGLIAPAMADTLTTVTTTTTEAPVSAYHVRRTVVTPVMVHPHLVEKSVTVQRSAVIKKQCYTSHKACVHHARHVAIHTSPRTIASSTTTKTITRTIEKPVVVEKIVKKPVYINHYIDRPVYTDRVIEKPVVINRAYVDQSPVLVKEKVSHHSDHDTIQIKRYY